MHIFSVCRISFRKVDNATLLIFCLIHRIIDRRLTPLTRTGHNQFSAIGLTIHDNRRAPEYQKVTHYIVSDFLLMMAP